MPWVGALLGTMGGTTTQLGEMDVWVGTAVRVREHGWCAARRIMVKTHTHVACVAQLLADLRDAEAAAAEHLAELRGRVAAKQEGIQQQQAALRKKVAW